MIKGRPSRRIILSALFLIAILLLVSCAPQSTFQPEGEVARKQLNLFWIMFGLGVFVFVVVEAVLIYSAFRYRRRPGQGIPSQVHGNTKLEVAWTIAPALVLIGIAVPTLIVIFDTSTGGGPDLPREKVEVIAHQWWWEFRYPEYGVWTANELHVPVGKRIDLTLTSDDVIHSFWVPRLAGKTDVIPRTVNEAWFVADEPGNLSAQCAEFCGTAHAKMQFRVIVQTQTDFDKWLADYTKPPSQPTGEAVQGETLFASKGCLLCHTKDGPETPELRKQQREAFFRGDPVVPGPNLTQFATRTTMVAGTLPLTESNLKQWLRDPDDVKPGNRMAELATVYNEPTLALTEAEVSALAAYLLTLYPTPGVAPTPTPIAQPTPTPTPGPGATPTPTTPTATPVVLPPGNADAGQQVFQAASPIACSTCHSLDGTAGLGPSLQGIASQAGDRVSSLSAEGYIRESILNPTAFVVQGFSPVMPTTFGTDLTPQQIADVIAFLLSLE
ncbi:MAG: cytochrome c oxidase subunit II [Dehalococcoidia bacterium]